MFYADRMQARSQFVRRKCLIARAFTSLTSSLGRTIRTLTEMTCAKRAGASLTCVLHATRALRVASYLVSLHSPVRMQKSAYQPYYIKIPPPQIWTCRSVVFGAPPPLACLPPQHLGIARRSCAPQLIWVQNMAFYLRPSP
jgi:hypothetical protein